MKQKPNPFQALYKQCAQKVLEELRRPRPDRVPSHTLQSDPHSFKVLWAQMRPPEECPLLDTGWRVYDYWHRRITPTEFYDPKKEFVIVFCLSTARRLEGWNLVSMGGLDSAPMHPREIYRPAIMLACKSIVLAHNHPSGKPDPSDADIAATLHIIQAGKLLGIELRDHVVIGRPPRKNLKDRSFHSIRDSGLLQAAWKD